MAMDVVYTYAGDGADPAQHASGSVNRARGTGHGELAFSIMLLLRHCRGQVRRIYVVHGGSMLSARSYRVLEQVVVLGGLEAEHLVVVPQDDILPSQGPRWCHNSCVIESHLWRLPRLSEAFLYLNDDMFFGRPVNLRQIYWGRDGVPLLDCSVMHAPCNTAQFHCCNAVAVHRRYATASRQLPKWVAPVHFPALMLRTACKRAWHLHRHALERMPATRDRQYTLNFQLLSYLVAIDAGIARIRLMADLHPWHISKAFVEMEDQGLKHILKHRPHWFCINGVNPRLKTRYANFVRKFLLTYAILEPAQASIYPAHSASSRGKRAIEIGGPVAS